jgi:hypothetical protein
LFVGLSARDVVHDLHGITNPDAFRVRPGYVGYSGNDERQSRGILEAKHVTLLYD